MRHIRLAGSDRLVVVDDEDYEALLGAGRWRLHPQGYAVCGRQTLMHRFILSLDGGDQQQCDHLNGDRLDNRRSNLRAVTAAHNMQNVQAHRDAKSPYRGVCWHKQRGRWRAEVTVDGHKRHLGLFGEELEAARAAEAFRREHMPFAPPDLALLATEGKAA